jgi:exonuclease SbcD
VKILHTSDWHVGRRIRGRDRSEEHRAVLVEIAGIAAVNEVDLTLVAGDLFDSSSPSPEAESIVWNALLQLSDIAPVVVVSGNHDNPGRLDAVAPLLRLGRISVGAYALPPGEGGVLNFGDIGTRVAVLPFVSQRGIVRAEQILDDDPDQHAGAYADRMQRLIESLTNEMTADTVNLLTSHLTVYGGLAGGGERTAHIFGYAIPTSSFPGHLSYVALGHLHRQQKMPHGGAVWYSGSPLQLDFGEVDDQKGVLLVEAEPGLPSKVTTVPLTAGRRLVSIGGTLSQIESSAASVGDSYVRVVLDESPRGGLADEVRRAIPNAVEVILRDSESKRSHDYEARTSVSGPEAFHNYLSESGAIDREVEALFAELLDEARSEDMLGSQSEVTT